MNLVKKSDVKNHAEVICVKLISQQDYNNNSVTDAKHSAWLKLHDYKAAEGEICIISNAKGAVDCIYFGTGSQDGELHQLADPFNLAKLSSLPAGIYELDGHIQHAETGYLAFGLAEYDFSRYKQKTTDKIKVQLVVPKNLDHAGIKAQIEAISLTRDLVNTPANDLGPAELAAALKDLGAKFGAKYSEIVGDDLLKKGFNLIHTVGRASADASDYSSSRAPRYAEFKWSGGGEAKNRAKLTLVGKGVVFDTGGLDLKTAAGMVTMKKDMGGAANVMGLAYMIMSANLPVDLTVMIGAVENSVAANAFRPSDVLTSYKGLTVEIGNTDAEGRLVLADLLAYADEAAPDLLIDMATLTGAARVAVGPEIAAYFTDDDEISTTLNAHSANTFDPIWQLPLHKAYLKSMDSRIADLNNMSSMPLAGASTAALFLKRFVEQAETYIHWDLNAWNISNRPARPIGGEAQGIRAIFSMLKQRYT
uniref:Leucyl aminopeptidase n=1 Tax=OCS116 cluster bacterium TaxID=2030921 RepID=A0A2A4YYF4_9PROT